MKYNEIMKYNTKKQLQVKKNTTKKQLLVPLFTKETEKLQN